MSSQSCLSPCGDLQRVKPEARCTQCSLINATETGAEKKGRKPSIPRYQARESENQCAMVSNTDWQAKDSKNVVFVEKDRGLISVPPFKNTFTGSCLKADLCLLCTLSTVPGTQSELIYAC